MATTTATATAGTDPTPSQAEVLSALEQARRATLALVDALSAEDLERVHSPIMSPLAWDLGHIAAYEDLWLAHRHAEMPLLRPDLADLYDAFETPRAVRGEIEALGADEARGYLQEVRARTADALRSRGVGDGFVCEMVVRHELQHSETMRQTLAIAGLLPPGEPTLGPLEGPEEWIEVPAGAFAMGARTGRFAYDNEQPRHSVDTTAFRIARLPVSCQSWVRFCEDGGYERPEWWSPEGWAFKQEQGIAPHPAIAA